ncbi:fimbrial protein [Serratia odorifera]|uniref:fimbrial protein n=1 Tax=Serratia odorifera TaxID=618 RepID=UPI003D2D7B1B
MSDLKKVFFPLVMLGGVSVSFSSYADCSFSSGYSADTRESINFGDIIVSPSAAVGSVIATSTSNEINRRDIFINCNSTGQEFRQQDWRDPGLPAVSYGSEVLYQSGVEGYAIRIVTPGAGSTAGKFGNGAFPRRLTDNYCFTSGNTWSYCGGSWGAVTFELVKISNVTGTGMMTAGQLVRASIPGFQFIYTASLISSKITNPTCSVSNANITVPMGDVPSNKFTGINSTTAEKEFNVALSCNPNTSISVTLNGVQNPDTANNTVLALDNNGGTGSADGVGVQLMYNNTPVALSSTTMLKTSSGGMDNITFIARYFQTKPAVTPGQANATALLNFTYQ